MHTDAHRVTQINANVDHDNRRFSSHEFRLFSLLICVIQCASVAKLISILLPVLYQWVAGEARAAFISVIRG